MYIISPPYTLVGFYIKGSINFFLNYISNNYHSNSFHSYVLSDINSHFYFLNLHWFLPTISFKNFFLPPRGHLAAEFLLIICIIHAACVAIAAMADTLYFLLIFNFKKERQEQTVLHQVLSFVFLSNYYVSLPVFRIKIFSKDCYCTTQALYL